MERGRKRLRKEEKEKLVSSGIVKCLIFLYLKGYNYALTNT